jgi:hypothetical protein
MTCYVRKLKLVDIHGVTVEALAICPSYGPKDTRALRKAAFQWVRSHEVRHRQRRGGDFRTHGVNVPLSVATGYTNRLREYVAAHLGVKLLTTQQAAEADRLADFTAGPGYERAHRLAQEQRELKLRQGVER